VEERPQRERDVLKGQEAVRTAVGNGQVRIPVSRDVIGMVSLHTILMGKTDVPGLYLEDLPPLPDQGKRHSISTRASSGLLGGGVFADGHTNRRSKRTELDPPTRQGGFPGSVTVTG